MAKAATKATAATKAAPKSAKAPTNAAGVRVVGNGTHRATQRGYGAGDMLVEAGQHVPAGTPVSKEWMEPVDPKADALLDAVDAALDPHPDDVPLEELSTEALQALATQEGIPVAGLSDEDLITAIKAARDPAR